VDEYIIKKLVLFDYKNKLADFIAKCGQQAASVA